MSSIDQTFERIHDGRLQGEPVALTVVHVVLDGRARGAHRVDEQLRLRRRDHLVVGALEHERRDPDVVRARHR